MRETELAERLLGYLEGYKVYQEVGYSGCVADVVVDVGGRGWVIETKLTLGLAVLSQASDWLRAGVLRVSVCVPAPRGGSSWRSRRLAWEIADWKGIGILEVGRRGKVRERVRPHCCRRRKGITGHRDILEVCEEEHKAYCRAGSRGGYWTPFKRTCREVLRLARDEPGLCIKEVVDRIDHHYSSDSSARACLSKWILGGKVPGVEVRRNGRRSEVFAVEDE